MRDYTGKTIFVGIDVHKKTYALSCICEGLVVKQCTMVAEPGKLTTFFLQHFPGGLIKTAYEAGFSGFGLHRHLKEKGIENLVVHAAHIETSSQNRVKTDKRDSRKIAEQLSAHRLRGIWVPDERKEAYRALSRQREQLMKDRKRVGNRFKSALYMHGLLGAENVPVVGQKWMEKVVSDYKGDPSIQLMLETWRDSWIGLKIQIKKIDKALSEQAKTESAMDVIYQSAPGIGPHHARVLANELEDMRQFKNEKQLFSFTGLTPCEYSSGEHKRQGHITRQGRSILRKVLVQAAWLAIQKDTALEKIFERISKTAGKKRAIIGIARRLIGRIRSCFMTGSLYEYGRGKTNAAGSELKA
jgi:transposase